jgi:hypothetical protein
MRELWKQLIYPEQRNLIASGNAEDDDNGKSVNLKAAGAIVYTIPAAWATTPPEEGWQTFIRMMGAGQATVTAGAGVTMNGVTAGTADINAQYNSVSLTYANATDGWILEGAHGGVT